MRSPVGRQFESSAEFFCGAIVPRQRGLHALRAIER